MSNYIPKEKLEPFMWKKGEDVPATSPKPNISISNPRTSLIEGNYILLPQTSTYAQGVHSLRESSIADPHSVQPVTAYDGIIRPLTFRENIEARVTDYENNKGSKDRLRLFNKWLDSCTGIAYKSGSTKFKVVLESGNLIGISKDFNDSFIPVVYDDISGVELDRAEAKYREWLTKEEVLEHPAWRTVVEDDINLLRVYADIVFSARKNEIQMAFWTREATEVDELRALFVNYLVNGSVADGNYYLNNNASFLRVA